MFAHFIPRKGKGPIVIVLPLLIGIVIFIMADAFQVDQKYRDYIGPVSFLLSSFIIWFYDGGPAVLRDGISKSPKSRHTLFWIEIKYWALVLGIAGCVWLGTLLGK
jgi:hypothetical protein